MRGLGLELGLGLGLSDIRYSLEPGLTLGMRHRQSNEERSKSILKSGLGLKLGSGLELRMGLGTGLGYDMRLWQRKG